MNIPFRPYTSLQIVLALALLVMIASHCVSSPQAKPDLRGEGYAGAGTCKNCHAAIFERYSHTAHALTTQPSSGSSIKGRFDTGYNNFQFSDAWNVVMERQAGGFYQTAYHNGQKTASHSFDVVVGSGRKAQTYLYYDSSTVYQLPISYFVPEHTWANSPNFPADAPKFDRVVPTGCFGCHSSGVGFTQTFQGLQKKESFEKGKIIYGIDCERCHGPAAAHVAYQEAHPDVRSAKFIASLRQLNRRQTTDLCGICHSGTNNMQQPAFLFKPGEVRDNYFFAGYGNPLSDKLDVHGNQYGLTMASACYLKSQTLTCNSCHRPHEQERENLAVFSQRCAGCHQQVQHSFVANGKLSAAALAANCIDCHMPQKASSVITLLTQQKTAAKPDSIRTHLIAIYKEETRRFLAAQAE